MDSVVIAPNEVACEEGEGRVSNLHKTAHHEDSGGQHFLRGLHVQLPDHPDRHRAGRGERGGHPLGLFGDLREGVLAVQALTAGQEPHFLAGVGVVDHDVSFRRCP